MAILDGLYYVLGFKIEGRDKAKAFQTQLRAISQEAQRQLTVVNKLAGGQAELAEHMRKVVLSNYGSQVRNITR